MNQWTTKGYKMSATIFYFESNHHADFQSTIVNQSTSPYKSDSSTASAPALTKCSPPDSLIVSLVITSEEAMSCGGLGGVSDASS